MASIHKSPKSRFWLASYRDATGEWRLRSTKTEDRKQAREIAEALHHAARLKKSNKLNPDTARELIAQTLKRMFQDSASLPVSSIKGFCEAWLKMKRQEIAPGSWGRYESAITRFRQWLGLREDRDLATVDVATVQGFRDHTVEKVSRSSAVAVLKVVKAMLADAQRQGLVTQNAATLVRPLKMPRASTRRAFTLEQIGDLVKVAKGSEMEGLITVSLYSGLRLRDTADLRWSSVDFEARELRLVAGKTGQSIKVPMAKPLKKFLLSLPSSDKADAPVFPKAAQTRTFLLSREFYETMVQAGLATARTHEKSGEGRDGRRRVSPLSFHSLRHSFVTILKSTGTSNAVAMELAGHSSAAVSQIYTHIDTSVLRKAVDAMPMIGKGGKR